MGQVTVRVNGYQHTIGCKDGEEQHVTDLIGQIEEKVRLIRAMGGQFSESRMLLHVALLLADEGGDLRSRTVPAPGPASPRRPPPPSPTRNWPSGWRASPSGSRGWPRRSTAAEGAPWGRLGPAGIRATREASLAPLVRRPRPPYIAGRGWPVRLAIHPQGQ